MNNDILKFSTVLDPRFKFHHIQFGLADNEIKEMMEANCKKAWTHWKSKITVNFGCDEPPSKKKLTGLSAIFNVEIESQLNPGVSYRFFKLINKAISLNFYYLNCVHLFIYKKNVLMFN